MDLNPECKLFIGGLNKDTTTDTLRLHFEQFGNLVDHVVITEGKSKISRGFGFVTYETMDGVEKCLSEGPHTLDGRTVDVKRAVPKDINRGNNDGIDDSPRTKKVFLGGLPLSITKEEIAEVMEEFGSIEEVVIIQEKNSKTPRGFGFVIFDTYNSAAAACKRKHIKFNNYKDRDIEVKPAMSVDEMKSVRGGSGGGGRDSGRWREDRERSSRRYDRGDRDHRYGDDYRYSDSYSRYLGSESARGGGDMGSAGGYRDREPLYNYPDYGSSTEYGMDRYGGVGGGSGDYRSTYRPPPPDSGSGGGTYGEYMSSSARGPGPGLYESTGSRDYLSAGSRGYESGSRGYGSEPVGEYGSGPGGFGTRPEGYGSDLGGGYGAGYGGYSSSRGGSGIGPIKSHDRPLLPSRGPLNSDGRDGPYGGMGVSPGGGGGYGSGGSARNPPGGGVSHGYHPYKR